MSNRILNRVFIVDDDQRSIELLKRLLEDNYAVEIVGTAADTPQAEKGIVDKEPDLLFLDVELPTMSGLDFCTQIRPKVKPEMKVVFYTGHDKYMLDALRRQAFDYLLKPVQKTELAKIMTRFYEDRLCTIPQLAARPAEELPPVLVVNALNEHLALHFDDICFFRFNNDRRLWEVVCADGVCHMLRHRTTGDTILMYSQNFIQIHKRYIVNVSQIKKIQDGVCVLIHDVTEAGELKISKNYRHDLMNAFYNM